MHSSDHELPHYIRVRLNPQPGTQRVVVSADTKAIKPHRFSVPVPKKSSAQGTTAAKTENFELF